MFLIFSKLVTVGSMQHSQKVFSWMLLKLSVSGNLLCQLVDHLLQFLVLKVFRVSYRPTHEQIFKRNYKFFNNNESKETGKKPHLTAMIWICFAKFINILTCVFDDHAPIKKLLKTEKPLTFHWQTVNWFLLATFNAH